MIPYRPTLIDYNRLSIVIGHLARLLIDRVSVQSKTSLGSSPPDIDSIDLGELPTSSPSPILHLRPQEAASARLFGVDLSSDSLGGFTPFSQDSASTDYLSRIPNRKRGQSTQGTRS